MENSLAGHLVTDNHVTLTDATRRQGPDSEIMCVNFDGVKTDCNCGIRHIAIETVHGGKPNGKCNAYIQWSKKVVPQF